ncbi:uncharacterized protein MONBRDRAFT_32472 [Monosiga brevicollis MX1]|uniref:Uncharacterized protein n=1 Tax=Monosiga brevicollis TaxID=81824 RepID=A9UZQ4_MONBE|nr:uncharacterized protein MONBRDRAFT_32472 [Monosiga brevicollis MX1]EDQ89272.1 predicted protein [Monosiga brevicollis MX1]|eukprot:XP_001745848.1 hypothetical protein [Monosiga brevicollis MX1]
MDGGNNPARNPFAHLSAGAINLAYVHRVIKNELAVILAEAGPEISLYLDPPILAKIQKFMGASELKQRGVVSFHPMDPTVRELVEGCAPSAVFIVRPIPRIVEQIANIIKSESRGNPPEFTVVFLPTKSLECEEHLRQDGVLGSIKRITSWNANLIPLDGDLLTMDEPSAFYDFHVQQDVSPLFMTAKSIMSLQMIYGLIPRVTAFGPAGKRVAGILKRLNRELDRPPMVTPEISHAVIFDRSVDLVTMMCTQMTYEGALDELYGIDLGVAQVPRRVFPDVPTDKRTNPLFRDVRDQEWMRAASTLAKRMKSYATESEDARRNVRSNDLKKMRQVSSRLAFLQAEQESIAIHGALMQDVKANLDTDEFAERWHLEMSMVRSEVGDKYHELIEQYLYGLDPTCRSDVDAPQTLRSDFHKTMFRTMRLMCLQSLVNGGLKKTLEQYKRDFVNIFGFRHLLTLENLLQAGLLKPHTGKTWPQLAKAFNLYMENVGEGFDDISFSYCGYCPLSTRLIDLMARQGKEAERSMGEALKLACPASPTILDEQQTLPAGLKQQEPVGSTSAAGERANKPVTLVVFVGGCTVAELSTLRYLGQQHERDYVVLTTDVTTGDRFLSQLDGLEGRA